jgi:hypothetical protein
MVIVIRRFAAVRAVPASGAPAAQFIGSKVGAAAGDALRRWVNGVTVVTEATPGG